MAQTVLNIFNLFYIAGAWDNQQGGGKKRNNPEIRAPKKWVAGARIQAQSTGGRCMDRALMITWGRVKGQIEGRWVGVA